ncbi:MAG: STY0301 family protein [Bosea sp. (in: a-proteobacteria)]
MTRCRLTALAFLLALANAPISATAQATFTCPMRLTLTIEKAEPISDSGTPVKNGVVAYQQASVLLKDADIFKGPGEGGQRAVPDDSDDGKPAIYRKFEVFTNGAQPRGDLHAVCHYEGGVSLDRRIGQSARTCTVKRDQKSKADDQLEISFSCEGVVGGAAVASAAAPAVAAVATAALIAAPGPARMVDCVLTVEGKPLIKEKCAFVARPGGSFSISNPRHAAAVDVAAPGQGSGRWSGTGNPTAEPGTDLGPLTRKGACWVNAAGNTSVCAR